MIHYDMPLITGSVENQLKMLKSFLFQQTEKMNYNLDMTTPEKFWQTTVDAIANADNEQEEDVYRSSYTSLKSLIIKSATEVLKTEQTFSHMLEGQYIAKSDFGTYFEKATVNIEGTPYGITQLYNYTAEINTNLSQTMSSTKEDLEQTKTGLSTTNENLNKAKTELSTAISNVSNELSDYKVKTSHYIKEGYLDTTTSNPVFGVEIGLLESVFTYDGKEISNSVPKKIRVTPDKMSFFSSVKESNSEKTKNIEVAYIEENAIYFPNAQITGGTLDIGNKTFYVDNNGNMTATSGRIGDWSINSTGGIQYHVGDKTFNEGGYYIFSPHGHGVAHSICGSPSTKDWILSISNTFGVTGAGKLYAKNAVITGEITATSGKIAGFEIADENTDPSNGFWRNSLSSVNHDGNNYYAVFMRNTGDISNVAFGVRKTTKDSTPTIADWNKSDYVFKVSNKGVLTANEAIIRGNITATGGTIGGWDITGNSISSDKSNYNVALCNFDNTNDNSRVLYCQKKSDESYTFRLYRNGALLATNADITGKITATSGSFTGKVTATSGEIGGWTITESRLYYGGWGTDNSAMLCPAGSTGSKKIGGSDSITGWTITSGAKFGVTSSGELYASGARFSGNIICWDSSHRKRIGMNDGALAFSNANSDLSAIYICGSITPFGTTYADNGIDISSRGAAGVMLRMSNQFRFYLGVTNVLNIYQYEKDSNYYLDAKIMSFQVQYLTADKVSETSDERLKENITALDKRYEEAFNLLLPCEFNFKGHSETSVGFTAQQVQRAFSAANIDADGFVSRIDSDEQGMDGYQLSIGYTRFVALNTHMIQKCLKEIAALKAEIQSLKQKG